MHLHQRIIADQLRGIKEYPNHIKRIGGFKFMDELTKYLTFVKPERDPKSHKYLPSTIIQKLREQPYISTEVGDIESKWIMSAIKLLFDTPRSAFLPTVSDSKKHTIYSAAVPYVLYAFKAQWGVKYSEWDLEEGPVYDGINTNAGGILLGYGLKEYVKVKESYKSAFIKPEPPPGWAPDWWVQRYGTEVPFEGDLESSWMPNWSPPEVNLQEIRKAYLTHTKTGGPISETAYGKGAYTCHPLLSTIVTKLIFRHMLTQTWVYTPKLRNPHMILSLEDIDEIPEPIEPILVPVVKKEVVDSPFDF